MAHDLTVHDIPVGDLALLPGNPRQGDIGAVAESMRVNGIYQPIIVNRGTLTGRPFEVIAGNHRAQAAQQLGHNTIPAVILDVDDEQGVDLMGLGGMVGRSSDKQMRWLVSVFKHQQRHHPDLVFHGWGVTSPKVLRLPFYSVDSSGWTSVFRYGQVTVRDPRTGQRYKYQANGRDLKTKPKIARLLRTEYGINPDDVLISNADNWQLHADRKSVV